MHAGPLHASTNGARAKIKQLVVATVHCKKPYAKFVRRRQCVALSPFMPLITIER